MISAVEARKNAYAPYSNFQVGAAVLLENGEVVIGSNQENAAYPSGLCAERVAIYHASAKYPNVIIKAVAISATSKNYVVDSPAAPCGNCRQSMIEYEQKQKLPIKILLMGEKGEVLKIDSLLDILPLAFNSSFL
ncbi:cytidine deaminase [Cellulophaga sp. HaHaR_3_176]|nr:cytidine deaminase [Cellulophaga sp. HaHaR_3_176]